MKYIIYILLPIVVIIFTLSEISNENKIKELTIELNNLYLLLQSEQFKANDFKNYSDSLTLVNDSLNIMIIELQPKKISVTATMYHPVLGQCDATPDITADQTKIPNIDSCSHLNWIAVSQDLLWFNGGPFHYGDRVVVTNAGHKDGIYTIRDAMNKRFTYKIDFLESVNTRGYRYENVIMAKL